MSAQINYNLVMETITCCTCNVPFMVPDHMKRRLREAGDTFWCPAGHAQSYKETEIMRLRKMVEAANRSKTELVAQLTDTQAALSTREEQLKRERAAAKKANARIHAGVCPCCNRTFKNLARHMATKHGKS